MTLKHSKSEKPNHNIQVLVI